MQPRSPSKKAEMFKFGIVMRLMGIARADEAPSGICGRRSRKLGGSLGRLANLNRREGGRVA